MPRQSYAIGSGWDVATINIESIVPPGNPRPLFDNVHYMVRGAYSHSRGQRRFDPSAGSDFSGLSVVTWTLSVASPKALKHLKNNFEGPVTANTTIDDPDVYEEWNGWLEVPDPADLEDRQKSYLNVGLILKLWAATS